MFARLGYRLAGMAVAAAIVAAAIPDRISADVSPGALEALLASTRGDWAQAQQLAAFSEDPVVGKLVLWIDATSSLRTQASRRSPGSSSTIPTGRNRSCFGKRPSRCSIPASPMMSYLHGLSTTNR